MVKPVVAPERMMDDGVKVSFPMGKAKNGGPGINQLVCAKS